MDSFFKFYVSVMLTLVWLFVFILWASGGFSCANL